MKRIKLAFPKGRNKIVFPAPSIFDTQLEAFYNDFLFNMKHFYKIPKHSGIGLKKTIGIKNGKKYDITEVFIEK